MIVIIIKTIKLEAKVASKLPNKTNVTHTFINVIANRSFIPQL